MNHFWRILWAEAYKQHRIYFHRKIVYFSLFIWPIIEIFIAYFMFQPFISSGSSERILQTYIGGSSSDSLEFFLLIGYVGYTFFFCLVQSAWRFTFERFEGTLELILLTPTNRFAVILGNASACLFESAWMLTVFAGIVYIILGNKVHANLLLLSLGLIFMTLAAVAWGTLLNSLFLLTRDAGIFFELLQDPLNFFGGVRVPIRLFTPWMLGISYCLPLTYCLIILRKAMLGNGSMEDVFPTLIPLTTLIGVMFVASYGILRVAERHAKKTGTLTLF